MGISDVRDASTQETEQQAESSFPGMSPLFLDGMLEFNRLKWGMEPRRMRLSGNGESLPAVDAVYYLDRKGRVCKPATSTYLPVAFHPTATESRARLDRQWVSTAGLLAADMTRRGVVGQMALPPEIVDVRPLQWAGMDVVARYTFYTDLPYNRELLDPAVRRQIAKSGRAGFVCERVSAIEDVYACVADTQQRQHFTYGLSLQDLTLAQAVIGEEHFRTYICYAPDGEPASTRVALHTPGSRAIDWLVGTKRDYLNSGATQMLIDFMLADLDQAGAPAIDFEGANLRSVAAAKANWGATLVPFYIVSMPHLKGLARHTRNYIRFHRPEPQARPRDEERSSGV